MTRARRLRTLALAIPVWIVMILTGGEWCLMPGSATAHPMVSSAAGAGHAADAAHHASHDGSATPSDDVSKHGGASEHGDGGGCESQAACSIAITPAAWQVVRGGQSLASRPTIGSSDRPASLALAPELPPPRA